MADTLLLGLPTTVDGDEINNQFGTDGDLAEANYASGPDSAICDSSDYTVFRIMEFGVKVLPSILFFILGSMRYLKIRDIGQGRVVRYSNFFKFKFCISAVMGAAYIIYVFICWGQKSTAEHSSWINRCNDDYFVIFYAIQGLAWCFSCYLMVYEYQRRLSEEWYANQLFWCSNFIIEVITFLVLVSDYTKDPTMMTLSIINMTGNLILIILMVKTERRTLENRRPEVSDNLNVLLMSNDQMHRRRGSKNLDGPFIEAKFQDKVIQGEQGINLFKFKVMVHGKSDPGIKLTKKYSEFQQLQELVRDQAMKQSDLFMDQQTSRMNDLESNRSYREPSLGQQHIPRLEDPSQVQADRMVSSPLLSNGVSSGQNPEQVVNFIKNLERFCNEVANNKLFWTPEVIQFFGIKDETLKKEYEFAREDFQRKLQGQQEGGTMLGTNQYRRQSYVNLDRALLTDNEITEEPASGDSGSTKNAKKAQNLGFFDQSTLGQRIVASNSEVALSRNSGNSATQVQVIEDATNSLHEELRVGQYPISLKFLMWQDSNIGNYIEFKLSVTYHEGHENAGVRHSMTSPHHSANSASDQGASNSWIIYKRYSNFVDLNDALVPYCKAEGLQAPVLPPKIANEATAQRNLALTQRKNQLQAYMRQLLLLLTDRAPIPLLQFLGLHEQPYLGFYSLEPVARLSAVNLRQVALFDIVQNKITFINNAPKVFYKVVLRYVPHYSLPGQQHAVSDTEEVCTFKQFSDFKQLDMIIKLTCFKLEESGHYMPVLPQKRNPMSGIQKSGDEIQSELVEYMRDLLKIPMVQRMFYMRMFLSINAYPDISETNFNEMGAYEGVSPNQNENYSGQSSSLETLTNNPHGQNTIIQYTAEMTHVNTTSPWTENHSMMHASQDINQFVMNSIHEQIRDDMEDGGLAFSSGGAQSNHQQMAQPGNMQQMQSVNVSQQLDDDEDDPFALKD